MTDAPQPIDWTCSKTQVTPQRAFLELSNLVTPEGSKTLEPDANSNLQELPLNVGSVFEIKCQGPSVLWKNSTPFIIGKKNDKYGLKILKSKTFGSDLFEGLVTSYRAGEHDISEFELTDGDGVVRLNGFKFSIQSVLEQGKPPQLLGPISGIELAWPFWMWLVLGGAALIFLGGLIKGIFDRQKEKKRWKELEERIGTLSAFDEFYRDLRLIEKRYSLSSEKISVNAMADLDRALRIYLERTFRLPLIDLTAEFLIRELHERHKKMCDLLGLKLTAPIRELNKIKSKESDTSSADASVVIEMCRLCIDEIEKIKLKNGGLSI